jgi:SAM-dependent methyltransferase
MFWPFKLPARSKIEFSRSPASLLLFLAEPNNKQQPMWETSDSEISVDRLMHEIRERVVREQRVAAESHLALATTVAQNGDAASSAQVDPSVLSLQPEFQPRLDNRYHVNDLLKYHGADFVRNAYRALLKREPEAPALASHLANLASGRFNKIDVLASLQFSPEGRQAAVKLEGVWWPVTIRRLGRVPVFGYLVQVAVAIARLPSLHRHQRQSEFYVLDQQQRIMDHANQIHEQLAGELARVSAQTAALGQQSANQQRTIESVLQQQQTMADGEELARKQFAGELARISVQSIALAEASAAQQQTIALLTNQQQVLAQEQTELKELKTVIESRLSATERLLEEQTRQALIRHDEVNQKFDERSQQLLDGQQQISQQLQDEIQKLLEEQRQTRTELLMQERRLSLLLETIREQPREPSHPSLSKVVAEEEEHLLDPLYASFEDRFRGPREEVRRRLQVYIPILKEAGVVKDVLDVGCGRGEWLELLKDEAMEGRGVDHNRVFVEQCRQKGLEVTEEEALVYLRGLPDNSLDVITSFHLVEHLPFESLIKLLDEMIRTLRSGGLLILETPNPENFMVGSFSFYADPTHRNPIPSATLQFLLESRGLSRVEVMKLRPWDEARIEGDSEIIKRFNEYFYSAPDYGVTAWKI